MANNPTVKLVDFFGEYERLELNNTGTGNFSSLLTAEQSIMSGVHIFISKDNMCTLTIQYTCCNANTYKAIVTLHTVDANDVFVENSLIIISGDLENNSQSISNSINKMIDSVFRSYFS